MSHRHSEMFYLAFLALVVVSLMHLLCMVVLWHYCNKTAFNMLSLSLYTPWIRRDFLNPYEMDVSLLLIILFGACTLSGSHLCSSIMSNRLFFCLDRHGYLQLRTNTSSVIRTVLHHFSLSTTADGKSMKGDISC